VAPRDLYARHAASRADGGVLQLQAQVVALVGEGGGDLVALHFVVGVVGEAAAQAQPLDAGDRLAQLAAHVDPPAAQVDQGRAVLIVIVVVVRLVFIVAAVQAGAVGVTALIGVAVPRQAVAAVLLGPGRGEIAVRARPRGADRDGAGVVERALQHLDRSVIVLRLVFVRLVRRREARDGVVIGLAPQGLEAEREDAVAGRDAGHRRALVVGRSRPSLDRAGDAVGRSRRHPAIDDVDRPADGPAAVQQGAGPAQDLDALDQQGLDADGVVGRDLG